MEANLLDVMDVMMIKAAQPQWSSDQGAVLRNLRARELFDEDIFAPKAAPGLMPGSDTGIEQYGLGGEPANRAAQIGQTRRGGEGLMSALSDLGDQARSALGRTGENIAGAAEEGQGIGSGLTSALAGLIGKGQESLGDVGGKVAPYVAASKTMGGETEPGGKSIMDFIRSIPAMSFPKGGDKSPLARRSVAPGAGDIAGTTAAPTTDFKKLDLPDQKWYQHMNWPLVGLLAAGGLGAGGLAGWLGRRSKSKKKEDKDKDED